MASRSVLALSALVTLAVAPAAAQQSADTTFPVRVEWPAYGHGGPSVIIDEAHNNFHTAEGRYLPFAKLLRADGYVVRQNTVPFTTESLAPHRLLVIANALGGTGAEAYGKSPFTAQEVEAVRRWVDAGGALLLIADHAPAGVAAAMLAERFGVKMGKGYTEDSVHYDSTFGESRSILVFSRNNGLLQEHAITRGRNASERISRVVAFTGQSLVGPTRSIPILELSDHAIDHPSPTPAQAARAANPAVAWRTEVAKLPTTSARGRAVGVAFRFGDGRVVVLGEAAMMTAQVARAPNGRESKMGMNVPGNDNRQFALNVARWLTKAIDP